MTRLPEPWLGPSRAGVIHTTAVQRLRFSVAMAAALVAVFAVPARATPPKLVISGANFQPYPLAVSPFDAATGKSESQELYATLVDDLSASGLFSKPVLNPKGYLADPHEGFTAATIKFPRWSDVGAEGLVKGVVRLEGGQLVAEFKLFDVLAAQEQLHKSYRMPADQVRHLAHRVADDLVMFFTSEPGPFETQIAFAKAVEHPRRREIFVSDWDGHGQRAVTKNTDLDLLPNWMPDGSGILYTRYEDQHPDLVEVSLSTLKNRTLSKRGELNTGGAVSPDGRKLVWSMSVDGNADIYLADLNGGEPTRLTSEPGIDTSPSWSPDGRQIAFVSQRGGSPQIYLMNSDGTGVRRLTYQGSYNQTPRWSPRGDLIAFTARDERAIFDLFTINVQTGQVSRITQDQGNNSDPTWSPNGRLLIFLSTRTGKPELWVTTPDGNAQQQLTHGGDYSTPSWGPASTAK
jgi:TolB protein